jgi:hypothetical protein
LCVLSCNLAYNYSDGVKALHEYRGRNASGSMSDPNIVYQQEWNAIRKGINSYENFWDALWFPFSVASKIMPTVIMAVHKKQ